MLIGIGTHRRRIILERGDRLVKRLSLSMYCTTFLGRVNRTEYDQKLVCVRNTHQTSKQTPLVGSDRYSDITANSNLIILLESLQYCGRDIPSAYQISMNHH